MLLPPAEDIALAATAVGILFFLRFLLTLRRIRAETGPRPGLWADITGVARPLAFGGAAEPDRRHALRQLVFGAIMTACGLAIAAFLVVTSVLTPFVQRGITV